MSKNELLNTISEAQRAINPLIMENSKLSQKVEQILFGALLLAVAAPIFMDNIAVFPEHAELLRHGIKMGLSAGGSIGGVMYILRGLGQVRE